MWHINNIINDQVTENGVWRPGFCCGLGRVGYVAPLVTIYVFGPIQQSYTVSHSHCP